MAGRERTAGERIRTGIRARLSAAGLSVAALTLAILALHAWWIARYRRGAPLDIDEAGYMTFAYQATEAARDGGLAGLWSTFQSHPSFGPLLGVTTVPLHLMLGESITRTFLAQLPYVALLAGATYGLGRRLSGAWPGAIAAAVVLTTPAILDLARTYHLVIPATALVAAMLYALHRTDGMRRTGWALIWGLCAGLALLTRTMMLGFLPAIAGSAVVVALTGGPPRAARLRNVLLGGAVAAAVAGPWYLPNLLPILGYLTAYGYDEVGQAISPFSVRFWTEEAIWVIRVELLVPLAIGIVTGVVAWMVILARRLRERGFARVAGAAARSGFLAPAVFLAGGYLALSTTPNNGMGFSVPLIPPLIVIVVGAVPRLAGRLAPSVLATILLLSGAIALVTKSGILPVVPLTATLPIPDRTRVWDASSVLGRYVDRSGYPVNSVAVPAVHRGWLPTSRHLAASIVRRDPEAPVVFATRDPMFNTNTVGLAARVYLERTMRFAQLMGEPRDAAAPYRQELLDFARGSPIFVVTGSPAPGEFPPVVDQRDVERQVASLGLARAATFILPDGRPAAVWYGRPAA